MSVIALELVPVESVSIVEREDGFDVEALRDELRREHDIFDCFITFGEDVLELDVCARRLDPKNYRRFKEEIVFPVGEVLRKAAGEYFLDSRAEVGSLLIEKSYFRIEALPKLTRVFDDPGIDEVLVLGPGSKLSPEGKRVLDAYYVKKLEDVKKFTSENGRLKNVFLDIVVCSCYGDGCVKDGKDELRLSFYTYSRDLVGYYPVCNSLRNVLEGAVEPDCGYMPDWAPLRNEEFQIGFKVEALEKIIEVLNQSGIKVDKLDVTYAREGTTSPMGKRIIESKLDVLRGLADELAIH